MNKGLVVETWSSYIIEKLFIAWVMLMKSLKTARQVRQSPLPAVVSCFHNHEEGSYEVAKFQGLPEA